MSLQDPISDMIIRIKNGSKAKHKQTEMPSSLIKKEIARILKEEGYIKGYEIMQNTTYEILRIFLKYDSRKRGVIKGIKRVSRPGRRIYSKVEGLPKKLGGLGTIVISTPKGVLTDKQAREENVGGEVLCELW